MKRVLAWVRKAVLVVLVISGCIFWVSNGCIAWENHEYANAIPPSSLQTFDDFLKWQKEINRCFEVHLRGVTYYHVIGPLARSVPSTGALYVFDAKGNYVGWSVDAGDVMRPEAVFYPEWWYPGSSNTYEMKTTEISFDQLKQKMSQAHAEDARRVTK